MARIPLIASLAWLLVAELGCASTEPPLAFPTTTAPDDEPRRAPGVAVDPAPRLPPPADAADSSRGLVVLSTPGDVAQAHQVVERFFRAVVSEAPEQLDALVSPTAWVVSTSQGWRERATQFWQSRLTQLEYGALTGQVVYRDAEVVTYRARDLPDLPASRRPPLRARGDDVVIRVPITQPRIGRTRLFGDEIWFLLRSDAGGYHIEEMAEDFRLP